MLQDFQSMPDHFEAIYTIGLRKFLVSHFSEGREILKFLRYLKSL